MIYMCVVAAAKSTEEELRGTVPELEEAAAKTKQTLDQVSSDAESAEEQLSTTIAELEAPQCRPGRQEGHKHS